MPWVKTDHNIHRHPKFIGMPGDEFQIWHMGLSYAAEWWTDGFVPASEFPKKSQQKFIFDLQKRNLWHPISQNGVLGYQIHEYEKYQTTKKDYEEKKAKDSKRKRGSGDIPDGSDKGSQTESKENPDGILSLTELNSTELNLIEKKSASRWPQLNTPTPVPPGITDEERLLSEKPKSPMPEDARRAFKELGYR